MAGGFCSGVWTSKQVTFYSKPDVALGMNNLGRNPTCRYVLTSGNWQLNRGKWIRGLQTATVSIPVTAPKFHTRPSTLWMDRLMEVVALMQRKCVMLIMGRPLLSRQIINQNMVDSSLFPTTVRGPYQRYWARPYLYQALVSEHRNLHTNESENVV